MGSPSLSAASSFDGASVEKFFTTGVFITSVSVSTATDLMNTPNQNPEVATGTKAGNHAETLRLQLLEYASQMKQADIIVDSAMNGKIYVSKIFPFIRKTFADVLQERTYRVMYGGKKFVWTGYVRDKNDNPVCELDFEISTGDKLISVHPVGTLF